MVAQRLHCRRLGYCRTGGPVCRHDRVGHRRALPTATVFRLLPATYRVWDAALFLAHGMLAIAALAALFSWLAVIPGLNTEGQRRCQARIARFWRVAGFPTLVLVLLFLLSGGGWSGRFSPFEMHYLSLSGLVPYSDAHDYYAAPFEAIYSGHWNDTAGHRPMAPATRSLVVALGGYSYSGALIVQTIINRPRDWRVCR